MHDFQPLLRSSFFTYLCVRSARFALNYLKIKTFCNYLLHNLIGVECLNIHWGSFYWVFNKNL